MKKRVVLMCLLLVSSMMLTTAAVTAKKPENPGGGGGGGKTGPTGSIFFSMADDDGVGHVWTIDPDGSDLTKRTQRGKGVVSLSKETHNGHYWYVGLFAIEGETYDDGLPRQEIYAVRDDNTMGFQMTDDETMEFAPTDQGDQLMWVPGDAYISWAAKVWADQGDGTYAYEYGIYRAGVVYDTDGDVSGLGSPALVYDTGSYYDEYDEVYYPNVHGYNWNPEGDQLVIQMHDHYIYIDDVGGDSPEQLTDGWAPRWSPDGAKILFGRSKEILAIGVDGTGETSLEKVSDTHIHIVRGIWVPRWSPDGKYVVYTVYEHNIRNWGLKTTMYTVKSDGSGASSVSGLNIGTTKVSMDWR